MPYAEGRIIHDADAHLMELGDCIDPYLTAPMRQRLHEDPVFAERRNDKLARNEVAIANHGNADFRAGVEPNIMLRKNQEAHGSFIAEDRPEALDLMGFASQLMFTTFCLGNFDLDRGNEPDLCYATASAHNRMMTDFCAVDRRLLPTAYIPLEDFALARACAEEAIELGAKGLMVPSWCPQNHGPSHVELDPIWALAQEAGLPILFHVGYEDKLNPAYKENGLSPVPDFHGGDANFTSVSYMPIPNAMMQTGATLIFDGVFDRFPDLRWGAIELGGAWLPGWMRAMDSAAHAFRKNEERLQKLSATPSEIIRRQFRCAPYPHEDVGWIVANAGPGVVMFSSDYPHVEGGRNPLKRFNDSLKDATVAEVDGFYCDNYIDMMGPALAEDLRRPAHLAAA